MSAHDHREFVPGCYRCDLGRDEVKGSGFEVFGALTWACPKCGEVLRAEGRDIDDIVGDMSVKDWLHDCGEPSATSLWRCISCAQWMVGSGLPEPHFRTVSNGDLSIPVEWDVIYEGEERSFSGWTDSAYEAWTPEHYWLRWVRNTGRREVVTVRRYCYQFTEWSAEPTGRTLDVKPDSKAP